MKTYEDVINEFFYQLKQIPSDIRTEQITRIVQKLQTLDLEVARRILKQLNEQQPQIKESIFLTETNIAVNDYDNIYQLYKNMKQDPTKKNFIDKCQYQNYELLQTRSMEQNNNQELQKISNKRNSLINTNEYFEMEHHIQKWYEYLKQEPLFNQYDRNRIAA